MKHEKTRDPFIDNARFILVALVVAGHFFSPIRNDYQIIYDLNNILGLFRMPALIILTGFLSKGFMKPGYIEKITKKILIPYLVFQFAVGAYYYWLFDYSTLNIDFLRPQYTLWFLLSLFIWNLLLFVFTRIKYPLLIAVVIGVLIGYSDGAGHYLSIHRTFVFFPFFLIGFYMRKEHFEFFKVPSAKIYGLIGFVVVWFALGYFFTPGEALTWIQGRTPYEEMGYIRWDIGLGRLLIYALSLIIGFAFLTFVPKNKTFFTHLGIRTAYIYILHAAVIRTLYEFYLDDWVNELWHYFAILLFSFILALILGSKPVVWLTKPFIEGKIVDYILFPLRKVKRLIESKIKYQFK
ncbi:fucose 4-O-acetylase-like acetyltransferase [Alkalibacillus filiformis]|uniref:Fucose 4-O-acetylase-like acetyltransferase n=1 Tax=Alkalibacillus filiformis TaxID=200990 RepID=A0ABU0DVA5_9BACI|nr:acyltransferase family protein [Alkalibacillus filiformis]MDQ0352386.1 fucose 4-O-acetylase-like acetyltransferase [Alkalibacillus filiformis]